ncbi:MAG: alpha/beta hydrolase [Bacteroidales bacterium]|nr:alpha/beta hydrolase [Bacteroidales bacterium]
MTEKQHNTAQGAVHYWTNDIRLERQSLVFLPGLTADHRLFDGQVKQFESTHNVVVWDAPGHGASRPFTLDFSLDDKARFLHDILTVEGIERPVLVGQSMGGYVAQCYFDLFPSEASGFISIDSAPLKRRYCTSAELWLMRHVEPMYRAFPWRTLLNSGPKGCCETSHGQQQMLEMMQSYSKDEYCQLAGHGYRILANAIGSSRPYDIPCPSLLLCGERDKAGSTRNYNRRWATGEGLQLIWVPAAGHNSNVDNPDFVNNAIADFLRGL